MQTELLSVSKIFTENLFRIPDYQRGYSWTEKQLKDFWNDIDQLASPATSRSNRGLGPCLPYSYQGTTACQVAETPLARRACCAATDAGEEEKVRRGHDRTMGNKHIVPYVLYAAKGYVSPAFAERTGFTQSDLDLLFEALLHMFEHDRSAARGEMVVRGLYDFEHVGTQHENNAEQNKREARLGCAHAHKLFEGIKVELTDKAKAKGFPESFTDYDVTCEWDSKPSPNGVRLHKRHDI